MHNINNTCPDKTIIVETLTSIVFNTLSYRGFTFIDQEMERETAVQYVSTGEKPLTQRAYFSEDGGSQTGTPPQRKEENPK